MFPTISDYNQAIARKNSQTFRTLHDLSFFPSRTVPLTIYSYGAGSYAVVFKATHKDQKIAVRCFISGESENIQRYRLISKEVSKLSLSWLTEVNLLENEINVKGQYYPLVTMPWLEGNLLNSYITAIVDNNDALSALQMQIVKVSSSMESHLIGHGDIQSGNIIIQKVDGGECLLKLIDYDGMFIPAFAGMRNLEKGRSEFQHPQRTPQMFNERIDRFSWWVILTGLEALKYDKTLWFEIMRGGYNTLDNMLFQGNDFQNPDSSKLFQRLQAINQPSLTFYISKLRNFCLLDPTAVEAPRLWSDDSPIQNFTAKIDIPAVESGQLRITSLPLGASVLTSTLNPLGTTPLFLTKQDFIGKTLIVAMNSVVQSLSITEDRTQYLVTFPEIPTFRSTTPGAQIEEKIDYVPPTLADASKIASPKSKLDPVDMYLWIPLGILFVIVIILVFKTTTSRDYTAQNDNYNRTSKHNQASETPYIPLPSAPEETPVLTDSVMTRVEESELDALAASTLDSNLPLLDLSYQFSNLFTPDGLNTSTPPDDDGLSAMEVFKIFLISLAMQNCGSAGNVSFVSDWETLGKSWFCSEEGFGSVGKIALGSFEVQDMGDQTIYITANLFMQNNFKGNKCYRQSYTLQRLSNPQGTKHWMITDVKDIIEPFYCRVEASALEKR